MKFENLQQIWDQQNEETMYAINQEALHDLIISKKHKSRNILNFSEWANILANIGAGGFMLYMTLIGKNLNTPFLILGCMMVAMGMFVFFSRFKRNRKADNFDQTIVGELEEALADSQSQVQLSQLLRWYLLPISILVLLGLGLSNVFNILFFSLAVVVFAATYWFSQWEHQCYVNRRDELRGLLDTLEKPDPSGQD
ncbi:hypothetical protein [Fodinibius halophilus]|nr:hypothetical protein [Fodinibius halophilus]